MKIVTGNRDLMRDLNTKIALRLIRESQTISQIDLVRRTQLSVGTIASIVRELKQQDFIRAIGPGESRKGRKPVLLQFNPQARYIVSSEIYADETRIVLFDLATNEIKRDSFPTHTERKPEAVFAEFIEHVESLLAASEVARDKILGIGVCIEGIVDPEQGKLLLCARWGWRDVAVKDAIAPRLGLPVWVASDGHAMVLGEYLYGAGRGCRNLVCIDIDAGIGSLFVSDGQIYRGAHHMAGEIGHTTVQPGGAECRCGRRGCLETVAAGWAILQRARQAAGEGRSSLLGPDVHSPSTRTAVRAVFEAARKGDPAAGQIIREAAYHLGVATASIINFADPELIVLIGSVVQESQGMLLEAIDTIARTHVMAPETRRVRVEEGRLKENAALVGMATIVCENAFRIPLG